MEKVQDTSKQKKENPLVRFFSTRLDQFISYLEKDRKGRGEGSVGISRRQFLKGAATLGLGYAVSDSEIVKAGAGPRPDDDIRPIKPRPESDIHRIEITESKIESNEVDTLVLAEKLCFYSDAPRTDEAGGIFPKSNDQFFHNWKAELLGFVEKPSFLILHTDSGNDIRSTLQSLNDRNIQCQFVVGTINGQATSLQASYLQKNRVNATGTVSGGEINPYEANAQFWGSLNIEIQGSPDKVESSLVNKSAQLSLDIMAVYGLKMSQVIGHLEVPNNGKPDPGRDVLKEIRTKIYLGLLEKKLYQLIDIFPDRTADLANFFTIHRENTGPAQLNSEGKAKGWLQDENDYLHWEIINSFLIENPEKAKDLRKLRNRKIQIIPEIQNKSIELNEVYMGFPPVFTEWLRLPTKPLGSEEFAEYRPNGTANFVAKIRDLVTNNSELVGSSLPFSYEQTQNLARLFIAQRPYENRGSDLSDAMVSIAESIGDANHSWEVVQEAYFERFGISL